MGFGFKNKSSNGKDKKTDETNEVNRSDSGKKKSFFNAKKKKKTLISQIKLTQSVPATIIDAINGSDDFINSENDFIRVQKIMIDDVAHYPVFAIDELGLDAIQISAPVNKEIFGQLSTGLKNSSGNTGFLPIATTDSLDDATNPFFGILPMHDAFQVLDDFDIFVHSDEGWAVALLVIANDTLKLKLCDDRYSMKQWLAFLNGECDFRYEDGHVLLSDEKPSVDDVFSISEDVSNDDKKQSDSTISNSDESSNGFSVDDFDDISDSESVEPSPSTTSIVEPVESTTEIHQEDSDSFVFDESDNDNTVEMATITAIDEPTQSQSTDVESSTSSVLDTDNPEFTRIDRDTLEAETIELDDKVTVINDLKISVSDRDFVASCLNTLTAPKFPLLDTSNDPTGRIREENVLRSECNEMLNALLISQKNNLRQYFEGNRIALLNSVRSSNLAKGGKTKELFDKAARLRVDLADESNIRTIAETNISTRLDELDIRHNENLKYALAAAEAEVKRQFNDKKHLIRKEKDDLIAQEEVMVRQKIMTDITTLDRTIQDISQSSASTAYEKIMEQSNERSGLAQEALNHEYERMMNRIALFNKRKRDDENKRVADQADIARNDTTTARLEKELELLRQTHDDYIKKQNEQHEADMNAIKNDLTASYESELTKVRQDLDKSNAFVDKLDKMSKERLEKRESELNAKIEELRDENIYDKTKYETSLKTTQRTSWIVGIIVALVLAIGGFVLGLLIAQNSLMSSSDSNSDQASQVIYLEDGKTGNSSQSNTNKNSDTNKDEKSESSVNKETK